MHLADVKGVVKFEEMHPEDAKAPAKPGLCILRVHFLKFIILLVTVITATAVASVAVIAATTTAVASVVAVAISIAVSVVISGQGGHLVGRCIHVLDAVKA